MLLAKYIHLTANRFNLFFATQPLLPPLSLERQQLRQVFCCSRRQAVLHMHALLLLLLQLLLLLSPQQRVREN